MKKVLLILASYLLFAFIVCQIVAVAVGEIPSVLPGQSTKYVIFRALLYFLRLLPALLISGFLVACTLYFGHHAGNVRERFSAAITMHFKMVMLTSIGMVCILALNKEIFVPHVIARQNLAEEAPELLNEYLISGRYCLVIKSYNLAHEYARQALKLAPSNKEAQKLLDDSERNMHKMRERQKKETETAVALYNGSELENETVTSLIEKSNKAKANGEWFYAHYYAQLALALGTGTDINMQDARLLASESWNHLDAQDTLVDIKTKDFYERKKKAYSYLMSGDNLEAYYAFLDLSNGTNSSTIDPDVKNFFEIAKERLVSEAFFIDETLHLQLFEAVQNIYFTITHTDGAKDVVFIKGITAVSNSGKMIQYLRDFTLYKYAADGSFFCSIYTPYAKMVAQPVSMFNAETREKYGVSAADKNVPYVILKSVAREGSRLQNEPQYSYADGVPAEEQTEETAMILALSFDDFNLVCNASVGPRNMYLLDLMKIVGKAVSFGYSSEVFQAMLISRLTYPILMLIVCIFCACFAWNYRVEENQVFKFTWSFALPLCTAILYPLLEMLLYVEDLICYAIIGFSGDYAVTVAIFMYAVLLVLASTYFLARKT